MAESSAMDIELGRLNADATSAHGPQPYIQEINEVAVFLENMASMVQKLKVQLFSTLSVFFYDSMLISLQILAPQINFFSRVLFAIYSFCTPPAGSQC
jgi:hypothetical protein